MSVLVFTFSLLISSGAYSTGSTTSHTVDRPDIQPVPVVLQQQEAAVFAKRDGTIVRQGPGPRDPIVAEVDRGVTLRVISEDRMRYQVRTPGGQTGYVARLNVTDVAPQVGGSGGMFAVRDDLGAGQRSNVTAIRGLSPTSEELGGEIPQETIDAYKAVKQMSSTISREELDAFARQGGVDPL